MSYRRRACYVCGQLGHLAQDCSSSERLCFNCGKSGHESSACPEPRSTEIKQCFNCQGKGHIAANCPTPRVRAPPVARAPAGAAVVPAAGVAAGGQGCFVCGGPHLKKQCPTLSNGRITGVAGVAGVTGPALVCHRCGNLNHYARDCKAPLPGVPLAAVAPRPPKKCYRCQKVGHLAKDCDLPADEATAAVANGAAAVALE